MAWPQFMSSTFPSPANENHAMKPSIYFLNAGAESDNGFGSVYEGEKGEEVTLEEYLTKGGVGRGEEGSKAVSEGNGEGELEEMGNQMAERGKGRKRMAVDSADRAALQRQKRMIKNRESAARSRERKQQYTNQLEQTVFKLEEENAMLLKEREKLLKWRFQQLVENVIPVAEQTKSERALRRTNSLP